MTCTCRVSGTWQACLGFAIDKLGIRMYSSSGVTLLPIFSFT